MVDNARSVVQFVENSLRCRMQVIQDYFNETTFKTCGICDVCIARRKSDNVSAFDDLRNRILHVIGDSALSLEELERRIDPSDGELFADVIRELLDNNTIQYDKVWRLGRVK